MFISFLSQNGGTGKTTLALHVAALMPTYGYKTLLIDADPQASSVSWFAYRMSQKHPSPTGLTVVAINNGTITDQLEELSKTYDCVIIDGPPRGDQIARDVVLASDIVLVPTRLSGFDVWAGDSIASFIQTMIPVQRMARKRPLNWFYVINHKSPRTTAGKVILKALEAHSQPVLETHICERTCLIESTSQGLTVFETEPPGSKAVRELTSLAEEIRSLMEKRKQERSAA